jgi:hypothetical protein
VISRGGGHMVDVLGVDGRSCVYLREGNDGGLCGWV